MEFTIPDDTFNKLNEQAAAAGFVDVSAYVQALAEDAAFDPRCGMSDEELRQSAVDCDAIIRRMKQEGEGQEFGSAWRTIGQSLGFKTS